MAIEFIKKRDGRVVSFEQTKIEIVLKKAYSASSFFINPEGISSMVKGVILEIEEKFIEKIPGVEEVQDIVERKIIERGDFEVARAYILYREERSEARKAGKQKILDKIASGDIYVRKRDGTVALFDVAEIRQAIVGLAEGLISPNEVEELAQSAKLNVYDGITTSEINKAVVMAIKARIEKDPGYSYLAARFLQNDIYKEVIGTDFLSPDFNFKYKSGFISSIKHGIESGRLNIDLLDFDLEKLSSAIDPSRDSLFAFIGMQTLYDRYLLRDHEQKLLEIPQYFWMRVAMGLALTEDQKDEMAIRFYDKISRMLYVPSTPTLLHSGTSHPQMSSCYITTIEDDLHHIFKCIGDNAHLAKWSGGVGNDWTNIRSTNSMVKSINTTSQGLIPFLKIVDATTSSINRSGKRRGATCVYLEVWHADIEDFLDLRKNTGDDRRRTHDINTACWVPDLFMKRVSEGGDWSLFSPNEVPELHHIYGKKFEDKYIEYEAKASKGEMEIVKKLKAQDLWKKMITMLFETGHPWITFKDPCNIRSPQDHVGLVKSSNLCTEITLNTSAEETAVCNLGSINLPRHFENGKLNYDLMKETVESAMIMLDNVIDVNFYPTKESKVSNLRHRPVGLGIMGFQDILYKMDMSFDSSDAVKFSDRLMEFVSYHSILSSSKNAQKKGPYSSFKGSKWERDILPLDTVNMLEEERGIETGVEKGSFMDWSFVRENIKKFGMRNSNCMAIAPTATISNISGCLPSIEPIYKNIYVKSNFSGEFTVMNQYLVSDLKNIGLWGDEMVEKIKYYDGNISKIKEIPQDIKDKYKEAFEIDPIWTVLHAAARGKWIDQSQSINIFSGTVSGKKISDIYMSAWKSGLKTTYYLRTLAASSVEKSTVDINKKFEEEKDTITEQKTKIHVYSDGICESCQ